jgi:hypothetical protein
MKLQTQVCLGCQRASRRAPPRDLIHEFKHSQYREAQGIGTTEKVGVLPINRPN